MVGRRRAGEVVLTVCSFAEMYYAMYDYMANLPLSLKHRKQ
jgi:hypothetical protein